VTCSLFTGYMRKEHDSIPAGIAGRDVPPCIVLLQTLTAEAKQQDKTLQLCFKGSFLSSACVSEGLRQPSAQSVPRYSSSALDEGHVGELYVHGVRVTSDDLQTGAMDVHSVYPALGDSQCNQGTSKSGRTS